jgi:hypothetical protein
MKISLSSHVVTEVVGDQLLVLDSTTQSVYALALADVIDHSEDFQSLTVSEAAESIAAGFCERGLATATSAGVSRRALVGTGAAVVGAGLLTLSLPTAAAASSAGGGSGPTLRTTVTNGTIGVGDGIFIVSVTGNVDSATSAELVHTFPASFIANSPISPTVVASKIGNFNSDTGNTLFRFPQTSNAADLFSAEWTMTLTYRFADSTTGTTTAIRQAV